MVRLTPVSLECSHVRKSDALAALEFNSVSCSFLVSLRGVSLYRPLRHVMSVYFCGSCNGVSLYRSLRLQWHIVLYDLCDNGVLYWVSARMLDGYVSISLDASAAIANVQPVCLAHAVILVAVIAYSVDRARLAFAARRLYMSGVNKIKLSSVYQVNVSRWLLPPSCLGEMLFNACGCCWAGHRFGVCVAVVIYSFSILDCI